MAGSTTPGFKGWQGRPVSVSAGRVGRYGRQHTITSTVSPLKQPTQAFAVEVIIVDHRHRIVALANGVSFRARGSARMVGRQVTVNDGLLRNPHHRLLTQTTMQQVLGCGSLHSAEHVDRWASPGLLQAPAPVRQMFERSALLPITSQLQRRHHLPLRGVGINPPCRFKLSGTRWPAHVRGLALASRTSTP